MYSGFNEPLLNKQAYKQIASTRKFLPDSKIELITNGDVLNEKRLIQLFDAGLSTLLISVYDGPEDMVKFEKMCISAGLDKKQYVIRNRYLPPEEDYGITMSNRGGLMKNASHKIEPLKKSIKYSVYLSKLYILHRLQWRCSYVFSRLGKKMVLGNLNKNTVLEIWTSKKSMKVREMLINGNRNFSPCNVCDVNGSLIWHKSRGSMD